MTACATSIAWSQTRVRARASLHVGSVLADRFAIERAVMTARMPYVYRACDLATRRDVAVKVVPSNAEGIERFMRDASLLGEVGSPGIVSYRARGQVGDGTWFSVEEWIDGLTLAERIDVELVPLGEILAIAERVARALASAHARGIVHGNVKPSNILCPAGRLADVKLIDFGIARGAAGSRPDEPRMDTFALGCLLADCVAGGGELPASVAGLVRRLLADDRVGASVVADEIAAIRKHEARTRPETLRRCAPVYGAELARGALCGDYIVERLLGRGGCGRVYRARHRVLRREAAVKVLELELAVSSKTFQRFVFEARAANRIRHPAIVDVHEFGRLPDGRPYFAMALLDGETLEQRLSSSRLLPAEVLAIVEQLGDVLAAVHAAGIVHRDIKPSNVFLEADRVRLMDFGIAKLVMPEPDEPTWITTATSRLGTPEAMAPEQIRGQPVDARTDIYGLGVLAYRMLTGRWPFVAVDDIEVERLHLEATPVAPSSLAPLPPAADAAILRCLAKDPADRFQRVEDVVASLRCLAVA